MCGGSYAVVLTNTSNITFIDNVFGTDIPWQFGPLYTDYTATFGITGNLWKRNTINILSGTTPYAGSTLTWTSGQQGYFMWPNSTLNPTDF